jgi:homodimeric glycerol 3-phosphate dehydrogenase (quinone) (EC 1.1.5.3)
MQLVPGRVRFIEIWKNGNNVKLKLSKGIHIVVPHEKAPTTDAIVFRSHLDRRQMFIIPRGEVTIIGTTIILLMILMISIFQREMWIT